MPMERSPADTPGYDIIGDVHGHATMLRALLAKLGYAPANGTWRHAAGRKAIFVGDLIDRGPEQLQTVEIVRGMVDAGDALCVMGNHEYNALQYRLGLRPLKEKDPHKTFLKQVPPGSAEYKACLDWFMEMPLWLDLGDIGIVHACWDTAGMRTLEELGLGPDRKISEELLILAAHGKPDDAPDRRAYTALENILKGTELRLPKGERFFDKEHTERHHIRTRWYVSKAADYQDLAFMSKSDLKRIPRLPLPEDYTFLPPPEKPIFVGHYWLDKDEHMEPRSDKVVCVDYSAGIDGPLAAYRWNRGDTKLMDNRFAWVPREAPAAL
ncbi:MAG: metallophosphoesterase [Desulfovibrionaceae bacterium]|nr:metallophosphoesterase [Desulfovibrionaceae bacterium]